MKPLQVQLQSLAFWSDAAPSWLHARGVLRGEAGAAIGVAQRPAPALLAAAERRRASDAVVLALHVASQAVAEAGLEASQLVSVFASPNGDLATTHYLCETLAQDPSALSPTKFINSVHNAVSGHWGMATGCARASVAVAAHRHSFANGLLEAALQCDSIQEPVLLVAYDTQTVGATAQLTASDGRVALAAVLTPFRGAPSSYNLSLQLLHGAFKTPASLSADLAAHAWADALPLLAMLAKAQPGQPESLGDRHRRERTPDVILPLGGELALTVEMIL